MNKYKKNDLLRKTIIGIVLILLIFILKKPILKLIDSLSNFTRYINHKTVDYKGSIYTNVKSFEDKIKIVSNADAYIEKANELEKKIQLSEFDKQVMKELREDNQKLKQTLDLKESLNYETIVSEVKLAEEGNSGENIYIKKGSKEGIKENQIVIYSGVMIGRITKVLEHSAEVTLITSKNSKISVILNNEYVGILRGNGNGTFSMKNYNTDISEEQSLVFDIKTSGISDNIIKGINIGTYKVDDKNAFKQTKELVFKPTYNYGDIRYVLILSEVKQ